MVAVDRGSTKSLPSRPVFHLRLNWALLAGVAFCLAFWAGVGILVVRLM